MLSILQILSSKSRFHDINHVVAQYLALVDEVDIYGADDVVVLTLIHGTYVFISQLLAHQIDIVFDAVGLTVVVILALVGHDRNHLRQGIVTECHQSDELISLSCFYLFADAFALGRVGRVGLLFHLSHRQYTIKPRLPQWS